MDTKGYHFRNEHSKLQLDSYIKDKLQEVQKIVALFSFHHLNTDNYGKASIY